MSKKLSFFIVDDDPASVEIFRSLIAGEGYVVNSTSSSSTAIEQIKKLQPDCVLCDLVMPGVDGIQLLRQIRQLDSIKQPQFVIVTSKQFDYDRRKAFDLGVDGYITKPVNPGTFVADLLEIQADRMTVRFFGVRGTLPVPGKLSARYGGNTNCVTLSVGSKQFFIFDAGTGIKSLSDFLMKEHKFPMSASIFITHPHYDHINGIPFFAPLYVKGNDFEFLGPNHDDIPLVDLIGKQMDSVYFPVTMKEFASKIHFRSLEEGSHVVNGVTVNTLLLNHPGKCMGFRVDHHGRSFCYVTDNELFLEQSPQYNAYEVERLINFIQATDVLVIDATYSDSEYKNKVGWGHSCVSRVVDVANKAKVKLLCLHHHDPSQIDKDIDEKLRVAREMLRQLHSKTRCIAPREGESIII